MLHKSSIYHLYKLIIINVIILSNLIILFFIQVLVVSIIYMYIIYATIQVCSCIYCYNVKPLISQNYQLEVESSKRQFEQRHMVNWITESVVKGITPQQVLYNLV